MVLLLQQPGRRGNAAPILCLSGETCSKLCGVPVIVCNQTGYHERMDMREAESAVIVEGQRLFTYKGAPAVLFCEWDEEKMQLRSRAFEVVHVK